MISDSLITLLKARYRLDWNGIHGIDHWQRVWKTGTLLAARNRADIKVVEAFAYLHDSCRRSDRGDHNHGARAAQAAARLNERYLQLEPDQLKQLQWACAHHEQGRISAAMPPSGPAGMPTGLTWAG